MKEYRKGQINAQGLATLKEIDEDGFHNGATETPQNQRTEAVTQAVSQVNTNRGGFYHANNNNVQYDSPRKYMNSGGNVEYCSSGDNIKKPSTNLKVPISNPNGNQ